MRSKALYIVLGLMLIAAATGCFGTHGPVTRPADFTELGMLRHDTTEGARFRVPVRQSAVPAATLPTNLAIAGVQGPGSGKHGGYNSPGGTSVVAIDDHGARHAKPSPDQLERLDRLALIGDVYHIEPMLKRQSESVFTGLRRTALAMKAELLLIYTFETTTETDGGIAPLDLLTIGSFPDLIASAKTSGFAVLIDSRTGYIYAHARAAEETWQLANHWTDHEAREDALVRAERRAFDRILETFEPAWTEILRTYATR